MVQQAVPTSVRDQIQYLLAQGMALPDIDRAERTLNHVGFHRLSSYWKPFESPPGIGSGALFKNGTSFSEVVARYMFDQRLRSLLLEAFSYIEVSVRTNWAYQVAHGFQHGQFAHQKSMLFEQQYYKANVRELQRTCRQTGLLRSNNFQSLTVWDVLPAMSFGQLSKWYSSLVDRHMRESISQLYETDERTLVSTLRHLTKFRNICAHHERTWNRRISTGLRIPKRIAKSRETANAFNRSEQDQGKLYNALVMTVHLMDVVTPNGDWSERFLALGEESYFNAIPFQDMGFPSNWKEYAIWQRHLSK